MYTNGLKIFIGQKGDLKTFHLQDENNNVSNHSATKSS